MPVLRRPVLDRATSVRIARAAAAIVGLLAIGTVAVAVLEGIVGVADASPVYLVAVVAIGILFGTTPAIATSLASVLLYDFLFTEPRYTLTVAQPRDWLDLLLFLFVAVTVGRLAALQRERADEADRRARESVASFSISRTLATAPDLERAAPAIVDLLLGSTHMRRIWIGVEEGGRERILAGSPPPPAEPTPATTSTLARRPGDEPARWVRVHAARAPGGRGLATDENQLRVKLESEDEVLGSIWARRARDAGQPTAEESRLLSLAADQVALALRREALAREATLAEIARQSDLLKSALLDSVSHDLRTPLASIRAAAGTLMDPAVDLPPEERRSTAAAIDLEAQRLGRFVRNMLDLSRIEAGALRPDIEALDVEEVVEPVVTRLRPILDGRPIDIDLPRDLPPILADAVFVDEVLGNLLDNAARYAPAPAPIRVAARCVGDQVELVVEDGGPGVPPDLVPRLFERFYRVERPRDGARRGMGLGLSVVKGLVEAMGGGVEVGASDLGGLAVRVRFRAEPITATRS
jgi:two-component system, OmpR family, sensor histidine kinase KdpD